MNISEMVNGQDVINAKRKEIDAFFRMIGAFLKQCSRDEDYWALPVGTRKLVFSTGDYGAFTLGISFRREVALIRGNGLDSEKLLHGQMLNGQSLRLGEVTPVHEKIGKVMENLLHLHELLDECMAYVAPFQEGRKAIVITHRAELYDYLASFRHDLGICARGKSISEAVGNLVMSYRDEFDLEVSVVE